MLERKTYFLVTLCGLLLAGFLATSLISYLVAKDSLSRHISDETLPLTSDNIYSEIQRDLLRPVLISSVMASDTFVRDWVIDGEDNPSRISHYLAEIQSKYDTITAFFVSEETHRYYHPSGLLKTLDKNDPADNWYFRVREMRQPYEINVDHDTADRNRVSIFVNYRVYDYQGNYIGATGVGLSVASVAHLIQTYQERYNRQIYFVDRLGKVTLHGQKLDDASHLRERPGLANHVTQILANPSANLTYRHPDKGDVYLNSRLVPEFDWFLVVEQHGDRDEARIFNTLIVNILVSLVISLVVLLVAWGTLGRYQRRLVEMATTDKLTGATNRQAFEALFDHAVRLARRRRQPLALLLIDLDHFKQINDQFGHAGGDTALEATAKRLRSACRESDALCRWGGEEFLVLMEGCPLDDALQRAEVLRQTIASQPVRFGREDISLTLSIGVAEWLDGEDLDSLVNRADGALYEAKHLGRNQVITAPPRLSAATAGERLA